MRSFSITKASTGTASRKRTKKRQEGKDRIGRFHDQSAAGEESVPVGRTHVVAQGAGGSDYGHDRNDHDQASDSEIYLNVIEWGNGVFGAEAAARYHFGTSAANLSAGQAAQLAAMVPSPRRYAPGSDTAYLQRRTEIILSRMSAAAVP